MFKTTERIYKLIKSATVYLHKILYVTVYYKMIINRSKQSMQIDCEM